MISLNFRIKLANKVRPILLPEIYEINGFSIDVPESVPITFSPLEESQQVRIEELDTPAHLTIRTLLDTTIIDASLLILFSQVPEIENLFEGLTRPRIAGKAYHDDVERESLTLDSIQEKDQLKATMAAKIRCRHGMIKGLCTHCKKEEEKTRKESKSPTVDVFEQLRFILQPPILERIGDPDVFPGGRKPYKFQIAGIKWLLEHPQALLADAMGLGKTVQAIVAMRVLFRQGQIQRVLVVSPKSVANSWYRELRAWAPELRPLRVYGQVSVRYEQWRAPAEVYIVTYESLTRDISSLPSREFDLCIIDEAQKIKNTRTANARAVRQINAKYRWALTGTPLENKTDDTVSIFRFLVPDLLPLTQSVSVSTLRNKIAPYLLRRTKDQVDVDFPELAHHERWLELGDLQRSEYERAESEGVSGIRSLGESATRVHVLSLISKLKQICNIAEESDESCKLEFLEDQLDDLTENGEKALVFSQYPNITLRKVESKLSRFNPLVFHGSLSERERIRYVDSFQNEETNQILLMSVGAGGTGITLTRANHVFHFDHWWNPAVVDQASARVHRIGQNKAVFVTSLFTSDTIEERVANLLKEKRELFKGVFRELEDKDALANDKISDKELFGLFDLPVPGQPENMLPHDISPTDFERLIEQLFRAMNYNVMVTQRSNDGGIDLDGSALGVGGSRIVVQCKRYKGSVSVTTVRELLGVVASDNSITQGFLVTTGKFTRQAIDFAERQPIRLIGGDELEMLLIKHHISVSDAPNMSSNIKVWEAIDENSVETVNLDNSVKEREKKKNFKDSEIIPTQKQGMGESHDDFISQPQARRLLGRLRDREINSAFPNTPVKNRLLREPMIYQFLLHRPKTREEFDAKIWKSDRENTNSEELAEYLDSVLEIIGKLPSR